MSKRKRYKSKSLKYKGTTYRSLFEVDVAKLLSSLKKRYKFKTKYESDSLEYVLPTRLYVPDFKLQREDGSIIYIEAKGVLDREQQAKLLAVRDTNPDVELKLVFMRDNYIRKKGKMKYSDWAIKHGFDFAIGEIPERWLK